MRKLTTAAIGAACLVLGAGGANLYTHAATGPAFYGVYETNVTDEDAYKKALPDAQKIIKEAGGVYIAGGFNKAKVDHGGPAVGNRYVIIRYENEAASSPGSLAMLAAMRRASRAQTGTFGGSFKEYSRVA